MSHSAAVSDKQRHREDGCGERDREEQRDEKVRPGQKPGAIVDKNIGEAPHEDREGGAPVSRLGGAIGAHERDG